MATLSLKKPVEVDFNRQPTVRKAAKVIDFKGHKPQAKTLLHKPRKPRETFEDLFGFRPRTTGEHIAIIRVWMDRNGYLPIPERFTFAQFASAMQWQLRARCSWVHFYSWDGSKARDFLKKQADAMLAQMLTTEAA